MAECSAGGCEASCKNGCGCIAVSGSDDRKDCECWCFGGTTPPKVAILQGTNGAPPKKVDVTFRGVLAPKAAIALSRALRVRLAVPTSLFDKRLNVRLKNKPVRSVIKHLGFVEIKRASAGQK